MSPFVWVFISSGLALLGFVCSLVIYFVALDSRGRPISAKRLKRQTYYRLHGVIAPRDKDGWRRIVLVVEGNEVAPDSVLLAVQMPMEVPEGAEGFYVIPQHDGLGRLQKSDLALVFVDPNKPEPSKHPFCKAWC